MATTWGSIVGGYGRLGINVTTSSTNTQTTVTVTVYFWSKYGVSDSSNKYYYNNNATSATTLIGSKNIKTTNNSGSGWSTSNQQSLASATATYDRGTSNKTIYCAAKLSGVDRVGGTMSVKASYTIPKLASYTVKYSANGGSGAPSSQTKWYGKTLKLSTSKPTRTGYSFKGWATSASGSVKYAAGANYTANASVTLYAVWELAYTPPAITKLQATRCTSSGGADETGTYAKVTFSWSCSQLAGTNNVKTITIKYGSSSVAATPSPVTTSGSVSKVIGSGALNTDTAYTITVTVTDSKNGTTTQSISLPTAKFLIDFKSGGTGLAIGKAAQTNNLLDVALPSKFNSDITLVNGKSIYAYNPSGVTRNILSYNSNNNVHFGSGSYDNSDGNVYYSGNKMYFRSRSNIAIYAPSQKINGKYLGENKVLWSGAWWPSDTQTCTLSEAISEQIHGVIFAWSGYNPDENTTKNSEWTYYFVAKYHTVHFNGQGVAMSDPYYGTFKYVYISDTSVKGHTINDETGTTNGVAYNNRKHVLRYIIGV